MNLAILLASVALLASSSMTAPLDARESKLILIFGGTETDPGYTVEPLTDGSLFAIGAYGLFFSILHDIQYASLWPLVSFLCL